MAERGFAHAGNSSQPVPVLLLHPVDGLHARAAYLERSEAALAALGGFAAHGPHVPRFHSPAG
jgi:hypothetical protein